MRPKEWFYMWKITWRSKDEARGEAITLRDRDKFGALPSEDGDGV